MHEPIQYPIIFPLPFPPLQDTHLNHSQTSSHAMMASPMPPPTDKSKTATAAAAIAAMRPADQEGLKCPRCDSPNTKFCYYNNYSLTQPRHFCKTCRRYWTKGGALRNVPVGGGCRKSKKSKCSHHTNISSSSALSTSSSSSLVPQFDAINNFHIGHMLPYYPIPGAAVYDDRVSVGSSAHHGSIASSIESLSSINQDLHWKLQQQRLQVMLFGGEGQKQIQSTSHVDSYQVADTSKKGVENDTTTAWFLENSFNVPYANINNTATSNNNSGGNNNNENNASDWNGIPTWSDMHHFTALP